MNYYSDFIDKSYNGFLKHVVRVFRREYTGEMFPELDECIDSLNECSYAGQLGNALSVMNRVVHDACAEGFSLDLALSEFCIHLVDIHELWLAEHDALIEEGVL